jgi:hypothetical protein
MSWCRWCRSIERSAAAGSSNAAKFQCPPHGAELSKTAKTLGEGLSPLQRGTARAKLAQGVEHEPCCGLALGTTNISAGVTPRLALRAEAVPLCEGDIIPVADR